MIENVAPHHLNLFEVPYSFDEDVLIKFENVDRERNIELSEQLELVKTSRLERQRENVQNSLNRSGNRNLGRAFDSLKAS